MRNVSLCILLAASAWAQLPYSATYDTARQVKLKGPVTQIEWVNPRAFVFLNVTDVTGIVTNWAVEIGNPLELERDGWKRQTLHIGDVVTVDGVPARGDVVRRLRLSWALPAKAKNL